MAQKALLFENNDIYEQIINCEKPGEAKEFGRRVLGFDEMIWNKHVITSYSIHYTKLYDK